MQSTSRSYNYATRQFEDWGVDDNGQVLMFPVERQLEFELYPPIPYQPPEIKLADDTCGCQSCTG